MMTRGYFACLVGIDFEDDVVVHVDYPDDRLITIDREEYVVLHVDYVNIVRSRITLERTS